jgi:glycosyltransferase EpsF
MLIGHAGRFEEVKNHEFLVRVFHEVAETEPSAHLVLFGDGPLRPKTEALVKSLDLGTRVTFTGTRSDLPFLLAALDLFLFPSRSEGLGMAALEAQAAGVPCVLARSVPLEADLGIGLTCFLGLEQAPVVWASTAMQMRFAQIPAWEERKSAICRKGLDVASVVSAFLRVYCSTSAVPEQIYA